MVVKWNKLFKRRLCKCHKNDNRNSWRDLLLEDSLFGRLLNFFSNTFKNNSYTFRVLACLSSVHLILTFRPLFFMSLGSSKLLETCNGTNVIPFKKFELLVNEYIKLKDIITEVQETNDLYPVSRYYKSYQKSRQKVYEELIELFAVIEATYKFQREKYLQCYSQNRDLEHKNLKQKKWLGYPYLIVCGVFVILTFAGALNLIQSLGILILTFVTFIPGYYLPKFAYFIDYYFNISGYLEL